MAEFSLRVNGKNRRIHAEPDTPLLWVLRHNLGLTGTKFGCGISLCGACTVHLDGVAIRSCSHSIADLDGREVVTIEGLSKDGLHPVQRAWLQEKVAQCGYCQSGQIMQAADLLARTPDPSDAEIRKALDGNLCRCGTYQRIVSAIHTAAAITRER